MLLGDQYSSLLSNKAGEAFFRAFIVMERESGDIVMKFRFKYSDGERSWMQVRKKRGSYPTVMAAVAELKDGMRKVLLESAKVMGKHLPDDAIVCFDPPPEIRDSANVLDVVTWMQAKDLIDVRLEEEGLPN